MGRVHRPDAAGALHHVYSRGAVQLPIFEDSADRTIFLGLLASAVERCGWLCHAYCLMGNHYHLVIETPQATLAKGMHRVNRGYADWFNRRSGRAGHTFDARYGSVLVENERHELELARYVVLNPVLGGICRSVEDWPWSNYRATVGLVRRPDFLTIDRMLGLFGFDIAAYSRFVTDRLAAATDATTLDRFDLADAAVPGAQQTPVTRL